MSSRRNRVRIGIALGMSLLAGGASGRGPDLLPPLVEVRGVTMAFSLDAMTEDCVPFVRDSTDPALCMPLREGEMVSVFLDTAGGDAESMLMVQAADGPVLNLWFDGPVLRVGGRARTLDLQEKEGWEWLATAPDRSVAELGVLILGSCDEARPDWLARVARLNPAVTIVLDDPLDDSWDPVLSMLLPSALWPGNDSKWDEAQIEQTVRLLALWPSLTDVRLPGGDSPAMIDALARLPRLKRLMLHKWDPAIVGSPPAEWAELDSLTLVEAAIEDLSDLQPMHGLRELRLLECGELRSLNGLSWLFELTRLEIRQACELYDVTPLAQSPWLQSLVLSGSEHVVDLSLLDTMPDLEQIGLPEQTTAVQLEAIIESHPVLRAVDVTVCTGIRDLSGLSRLPWLERVGVSDSQDLDTLAGMVGLQFVRVLGTSDDDSARRTTVADLRNALPEADVVVSQPVCLGAGEILWLVGCVGLVATWRRLRVA